MNDMKIVKSLEQSGVLIKGVCETIQNEAKEQNRFLGMLLGRLGVSLSENLWTSKGVIRAGKGTIRAGEGMIASSQGQGTIRAGQDS